VEGVAPDWQSQEAVLEVSLSVEALLLSPSLRHQQHRNYRQLVSESAQMTDRLTEELKRRPFFSPDRCRSGSWPPSSPVHWLQHCSRSLAEARQSVVAVGPQIEMSPRPSASRQNDVLAQEPENHWTQSTSQPVCLLKTTAHSTQHNTKTKNNCHHSHFNSHFSAEPQLAGCPDGFLPSFTSELNFRNKWYRYFYRLDVFPLTQPSVSKHWRKTEHHIMCNYEYRLCLLFTS